ncbi:hypothetical protein [Timonella sp. A28]|uniref:hypothetical protein n=1 Tax=Timonella sp. A28 TaxID=3442640 RepID=UPI003EBF583B
MPTHETSDTRVHTFKISRTETVKTLIFITLLVGSVGGFFTYITYTRDDSVTFVVCVAAAITCALIAALWVKALPFFHLKVALTESTLEVRGKSDIKRSFNRADVQITTAQHAGSPFNKAHTVVYVVENNRRFPLPTLTPESLRDFLAVFPDEQHETTLLGTSLSPEHDQPSAPPLATFSLNLSALQQSRRKALIVTCLSGGFSFAGVLAVTLIPAQDLGSFHAALTGISGVASVVLILSFINLFTTIQRLAKVPHTLSVYSEGFSVDNTFLRFNELKGIKLSPLDSHERVLQIEFLDGSTHGWFFYGSTKKAAHDPLPQWAELLAELKHATPDKPMFIRDDLD